MGRVQRFAALMILWWLAGCSGRSTDGTADAAARDAAARDAVLATQPASSGADGDGIQALASPGSGSDVASVGNLVRDSARIGVALDQVGGAIGGNTIANSASFGCVLQQSSAQLGTNTFSGNAAGDAQRYATAVISFAPPPPQP